MNPEQIRELVREQGDFVFKRMFSFMKRVKERLARACNALELAKIDYAVVGGNAVAAWVSTKDEGAIRTTQNVDILLRPRDFEAAKSAFDWAGFVAIQVMGTTIPPGQIDLRHR